MANTPQMMKVESENSDIKVLEEDCSNGGGYYMPNVVLHPKDENAHLVAPVRCSACLLVKGIRFIKNQQAHTERNATPDSASPKETTQRPAASHPPHLHANKP